MNDLDSLAPTPTGDAPATDCPKCGHGHRLLTERVYEDGHREPINSARSAACLCGCVNYELLAPAAPAVAAPTDWWNGGAAPEEIRATAGRLLAFISKHAGQTPEQIPLLRDVHVLQANATPRIAEPEPGEARKCLICAQVKPWGVWSAITGDAVCVGCWNNARNFNALQAKVADLECRPLVLFAKREAHADALTEAQVCDRAEATRRAARRYPLPSEAPHA